MDARGLVRTALDLARTADDPRAVDDLAELDVLIERIRHRLHAAANDALRRMFYPDDESAR